MRPMTRRMVRKRSKLHLRIAGQERIDCIIEKKVPTADGRLGLRVVEIIEAATSSMRGRGETIHLRRKDAA